MTTKTACHDSAIRLLRALEPHVALGIVTSSPKWYAERLVQLHCIGIPVIASYRDTRKHKPDPAPLLFAAKELDVSPDQVISIGDTVDDTLAGKAARMITIAVTWGDGQRGEIERTGKPHFMVDSIEELQRVVLTVLGIEERRTTC